MAASRGDHRRNPLDGDRLPGRSRARVRACRTGQESGMKRFSFGIAAVLGIALFGWTVYAAGPRVLLAQMSALAAVLPLIMLLAAVRFMLQAAGWRLAMRTASPPPWREVFGAVVAGEAAGYFAWGPVTREPMKAMLVANRMPQRAALTAAVFERLVYAI